MRDVRRDIVFETAFSLVAVTQLELNTHIIHRAGVHPLRCAFTHHTDTGHEHKDVFRLFVEPVERTVERLLEEREIETDVGLAGGLPFDIVVTNLRTAETGRKDTTTIAAGDVIRRTVRLTTVLVYTIVGVVDSITRGSIDILVTRLTPRDAQLQIVHPRAGTCHELLLADTPTGGNRGEESKAVVFTETA